MKEFKNTEKGMEENSIGMSPSYDILLKLRNDSFCCGQSISDFFSMG